MKILKILKDKDLPKEVSEPVSELTSELKEFCIALSMTMRYYNGIGIAAPQVGVLKRIIVIDAPYADIPEDRIYSIMINPEIVQLSEEKQRLREGCLSFPKEYIDTERPLKVTVRWLDTLGETKQYTFVGLPAAVVLHELDHLDGITFRKFNEN